MKVLIVLGGDAPGVELLKACVDEADFSIAADRGLEAFDAAGLEPDMLVGDMDSVSQNVLARYESRLSEDRLNCIKKRHGLRIRAEPRHIQGSDGNRAARRAGRAGSTMRWPT